MSESEVEHVMSALARIWPDQMLAKTGSGLQWGQLVAVAAVGALDEKRADAAHERTHEIINYLGVEAKACHTEEGRRVLQATADAIATKYNK